MLENQKTMTEKSMDDSMMGEMDATPKKMTEMPECAIIGLIKNHKIELKMELKDAKEAFADAVREDENWTDRNNKEKACSVIEGKIEILNQLQKNFEDMFTPKMPMPA